MSNTMAKRVSVRQLTREFKAVIKLLPVIITDNGKDRYILKELSDNQVSDKVSDSKMSDNKPKVSDNSVISPIIPKNTAKPTHRPLDTCPKHNVFYKSCGCR